MPSDIMNDFGNYIGDDERYYYKRCVESKSWVQGDRKRALDLITKYYREGSIDTMLEVGCGVGDIVPHLPERMQYTGLDPVAYCVREGSRQYPGHRFVIGHVGKLPFNDGSFDLVFSSQTLEMFDDPRGALREMVRVVRPGGYILTIAPNLECPWGKVNAVRHYSLSRRIAFIASRFIDLSLRFLGISRFRIIPETYVEATGKFEKKDDDLKYVTSAWEVTRALRKYGFQEIYAKKASNALLRALGPLRYYGGGMFLFFHKQDL